MHMIKCPYTSGETQTKHDLDDTDTASATMHVLSLSHAHMHAHTHTRTHTAMYTVTSNTGYLKHTCTRFKSILLPSYDDKQAL